MMKGGIVMTVVKWTPMKELEDMRRSMEQLFEEFFETSPFRRRWWGRPAPGTATVPNVELYDREKEIVLRAELPGVEKKDIELSITEENITFKVEKKRQEEVKEDDFYASEITYGALTRTVPLPVEVESAKARASYKNGILEVVIPKKVEAQPKEIKLEVS
jgi:HSP20 family protein